MQLGRNFSAETVAQRLERDTRQELYASLLGKGMGFHDLRPTGEIMARATNDVRELALMIAPGLSLVFGSSNFLIVPIFVAPTIYPSLIVTPLALCRWLLPSPWSIICATYAPAPKRCAAALVK